jgi:ADP-heptose:LPS heptosyltransferase
MGYNNAKIDVVVKSHTEADIMMASGVANDVIVFHREGMTLTDKIRFIFRLFGRYRMLISTVNINARMANLLGKLSLIQKRIGLSNDQNYTINVSLQHVHKVDNNLEIARLLQCPEVERTPQMTIPNKYKIPLNISKGSHIIIGVHLSTGILIGDKRFDYSVETFKEIPLSFFLELITAAETFFNDPIAWIFVGGKREKKLFDILSQHLSSDFRDMIGKYNILQTASILQQVDLLISGDSGLSHLAAAVGIPVIALFGPTDPSVTGPIGNQVAVFKGNCSKSPCYPHDIYNCNSFNKDQLIPNRKIPSCMTNFNTEQILNTISSFLSLNNREKNMEV